MVRTICLLVALATWTSCASAQPIRVYFNRPIDSSLALHGNVARGSVDFSELVRARIASARSSIDVAMYSLNLPRISTALIDAARRGVHVRCVTNASTLTAPGSRFAELRAAGIPVLASPAGDPTDSTPDALMHHKFIVIDSRNRASNDPAVIAGSWNATAAQTWTDVNNVVVVEDSSVAAAFEGEFEEMWGSSGDMPDSARSRFSSAKRDDTRHSFTLRDGTTVELWFAPSDAVEDHVRRQLRSAETSLQVAAFTITSGILAWQIGQQRENHNADVRVIIDNVDDDGSQFARLAKGGEALDWRGEGLFHHKYAVVDALPVGRGSDPTVITGSYNWTWTGANLNDENVFAIHSATIANQYLQEFAARYREAGGTRTFGPGLGIEPDSAAGQRMTVRSTADGLAVRVFGARGRLQTVDLVGRILVDDRLDDGAQIVLRSEMSTPVPVLVRFVSDDGFVETASAVMNGL